MSSKGTIIYVGGFKLPDGNAAAHRVLAIGKILRKLNYKVIFIGVSNNINETNGIKPYFIQGFECYSVQYPNSKKEWMSYLTNTNEIRKIASFYNDLKFIIAYNYPSAACMSLKRFFSTKGIKIIADCTEWYGTKGEKLSYKIIKGLDTFFRMKIINPRLDGLIVISDFLENYYKKKKSRVINIPPLIDKDEEKWRVPRIPLDNNKINFVYSGNPGKNKDNISMIIESFLRQETKKEFVFHILGISEKEYFTLFPHYHKKENLGENIRFYGRVTHQESIQYIRSADYFIFLREINRVNKAGFPTKFVEAITCNTKVITNNSTNLSRYLICGQNGYLIDLEKESFDTLYNEIILNQTQNRLATETVPMDTFDYSKYIKPINLFLNRLLSQ